MATIRTISHIEVIRALRHPQRAKRWSVPNIPFDAEFSDVEKSVRLTIAYLSACEPPFVGGKIEHFSYGLTTALWPLDVQSEYTTEGEDGSVKVRTDYFFFIEARGHLFVRMNVYKNLVQVEKGILKSTHSASYSDLMNSALLAKLEQFRATLVSTKIPRHVRH